MRRNTPLANVIFALALMTIAWGVDFAFIRDLTGQFTYYGRLTPSVVEVMFSWMALLGGAGMLVGAFARSTTMIRLSMLLTAGAYALFASGFLGMTIGVAIGAVPESASGLTNWYSRSIPSIPYLGLVTWYVLAATRPWSVDEA